ncbi:DUF2125 domain-containing protein [Gymnodinialimonas hymeniacidonis]|uniref:DUF2125 domain-containing protein n=1 Tax=Gymnodinialimonas hymeniacidonis TaxID=3126508 RepID=UPI0034C68309
MKRLLILIIVLAVLGGIAWAVAAMTMQTAATRWLDDRQVEGWVVNVADVSVEGFPLDFETEFTDIQLADPETGLAWSTPRFRLEQEVFRLDRLAAYFPEEQIIASPEERLTLTSSAMFANLDVQPTSNFALDGARGFLSQLEVTSSNGWTTALEEADLTVTRMDGEDRRYEVNLIAFELFPPEVIRNRLDPVGVLPERINQLSVNTRARFDQPWDMTALEDRRPQPTELEIESITATWGDMLFRATGTLDVTAGGIPEGELAVRAENWRAMLELAENAGVLPERIRPTAEAMLEVLAGMNGSAENIDATLNFSNGRVFIGPLPIGPAPSLRIR